MRLRIPLVGRYSGRLAVADVIPDDVEPDVVKIWIAIVAVGAPVARAQVHFNISRAWGVGPDLQDGSAKIRSAFQVGEARMKHAHAFAGNGFEFASAKPLVLPDGLDEPFRREPFVAQTVFGANACPPLGVKVVGEFNQAPLLLEFWRQKVNLN